MTALQALQPSVALQSCYSDNLILMNTFDRPLTSPCFPFPRTRRAVNRFILFFNYLFLSSGQFRRRNRLFGVIIASSVFWLRNMIVFGTSKQCFQAEMIQKCVFIFFSLFTKVVAIHLSNFFNDGSFNFSENIFFTCYFLGPSGTSMSDFMSFVCISVYCRTQRVFIHFCDGSTPLKKNRQKQVKQWTKEF